jgi:RimJ/RimL family protein N-acetyltransferase
MLGLHARSPGKLALVTAHLQRLRSERLVLREWTDADLEPFAAMNADPAVVEHLPGPLSREASDELVLRFRKHFAEHGFGLWAVELAEQKGSCLGFLGLWIPAFAAPFMPCVEVGWRLARAHWGRGYATEGAKEAIRSGFVDLGLAEIVSMTVPANVRSRRVMEKLGMTRDPADDFDHPRLPEGSPLRRHVLYRLGGATWRRSARKTAW